MIEMLIKNRADVNIRNKINDTALIIALNGGINSWDTISSKHIQNFLCEIFLNFLGFDRVAELLIQKRSDINIMGNRGKTALMSALEKGKKHNEVVTCEKWLNCII